MKTIEGDLIELADAGRFDVIIHGCNCFHSMGAGIAAQIAKRWRSVLYADLDTEHGGRAKLGGYSWVDVQTKGGARLSVVNAYTQHIPGPDANLAWIEGAMREVAGDFDPSLRIGYPMIGCGIGGLGWRDVAPIMYAAFDGRDHTLVVLPTR